MKKGYLFLFIVLFCSSLIAQDTVKLTRKSFDISAFSNDDTLTHSDYLQGIERAFKTLNKAPGLTQDAFSIDQVIHQMDEDDSALSIIRSKLSSTERLPNIRNLQMFHSLLFQLNLDTRAYIKEINAFDNNLDGLKKEIFGLRKDSVVKILFSSPSMWTIFESQMIQLAKKWKDADSTVKRVNILIDKTLARTSASLINIEELQRISDDLLKSTGSKAFSKERRYLWEPRKTTATAAGFKKSLEDENKIAVYYFMHTRSQLYLLVVIGLLFFYWVSYNFSSLRRMNKLDTLNYLGLVTIKRIPILSSLLLILNLAPLFDLNAPAIYIDSVELLLMLVLTIQFRQLRPRFILYLWLLFVLLFLLGSYTRFLGMPVYLQRWSIFICNVVSLLLGLFTVYRFRKRYSKYKLMFWVAGLYIFFNLLAVTCNLFGRATLTQLFGSAAVYSFAQTIGLVIFVNLFIEAFLLQIQASRVRQHYPEKFDHITIAKGISRFIIFLAVFIWLVVFTTNLNIYMGIEKFVLDFLTTPRGIGKFSFSLSGVILFLLIIGIANYLQKYIAYFFGDVGDDVSLDNKGQRSRLLITRLVLLTLGFLLAVAASGLPIDKITFVLGALGVGIGLGLQNIVNNFVSGIILIFDRPLRIGDTVEIGDKKGRVKEISVRSSTLLTSDGAEVIIPNGDILSHNIVNWTLSNNYMRSDISYLIDKKFLSEENREAIKNMVLADKHVLAEKEPQIVISNISSQSTQLKILFWCKDVTKADMAKADIYKVIYQWLEDNGVKVL
jgi:potassium efflux system protein